MRTAHVSHRHYVLVPVVAVVLSLGACGDGGGEGDPAASPPKTSLAPSSTSARPDPIDVNVRRSGGTPIRITFGDTQITGRLDDTAIARDLAAQLPLTLTFRDHNEAEKTARLPRVLSVEDSPNGHDPAAGDIGYWAPGNDLVFYYDDAALAFDGIVRIGTLDGDAEPLRRQTADFAITVERAG